MIPRTKSQKEFARISSLVKPITDNQKSYYIRHSNLTYVVSHSGETLNCLSCGHKWKDKVIHDDKSPVTCPHCGKYLYVQYSKKRKIEDEDYYAIVTSVSGYQVIRMFYVVCSMSLSNPAVYEFHEVYRWVIDKCGKAEVFALSRNMFGYYLDNWCLYSSLELRKNKQYTIYNIMPSICLHSRIIPRLKQVGYDSTSTPNIRLILKLLVNNRVETLYKTNQLSAVQYAISDDIEPYWSSIRICLRHNYMITDDWFRYVRMLNELGKDTHNPYYVCPKDFTESYSRIMKLYTRKEEEIRRKRELEELKLKEANYANEKGKYLNLLFTDGNITIRPLQSVKEFYEEASVMHHCVYQQGYYKYANSLIFTARVNDVQTETVEVSLTNHTVVQSRAKYNNYSPYHDDIISLVNRNMQQIVELQSA